MPKESVNPGPTFEAAMARLEGLVEAMEAEKLPLDELLVRYEEGIKLVKLCSEKLTAAEQRIEIIARDAEGNTSVEALEFSEAEESGKSEKKGVSLF